MSIATVLLVDDEPDIRTVAELSLSEVGGWSVHLAASGDEALAFLASERPDLILLDVMMPDLDGPGVLARIKADPALVAIPVIFLTAKIQQHKIERLLSLGARGVIAKPFDPMTLPAQITRIVQGG